MDVLRNIYQYNPRKLCYLPWSDPKTPMDECYFWWSLSLIFALYAYKYFLAYLLLILQKNSFSHSTIWIMLLYRSPSWSLTRFFSRLENLLNDRHIIDTVLGDFNIDILNSTNIHLQKILSNYTLLVNEATHISGSLLDHVYVDNETLQKFSVEVLLL